ncbi:MAG: LysM peptidoglycan-binding domain-containing protein [Treponema sp.]|jgi:nucleoid-associated protein YgaU|nr:LysM peptidoglycan-binding domain-containing protein [Treponema sp.]
MNTIGIKLADGSFYPILEEGKPAGTTLDLTTVSDNQTTVQVDLYRSETGSMEDAEYVDSLQIDNLVEHPNGEPDISLKVNLDDDNNLSAEINDPESGGHSQSTVTLVTRTLEERSTPTNFEIAVPDTGDETPEKTDGQEATVSAGAAGAGLGAAAAAYLETQEQNKKAKPEETEGTDTAFEELTEESPEEIPAEDSSIAESELTALEEENETPSLENPVDEPFSFDSVADETSGGEPVADETPPSEPDTAEADEADATEDFTDTLSFAKQAMDDDTPEPENFDLPDFDDTEFTAGTVSPDETVSFDDADIADESEEIKTVGKEPESDADTKISGPDEKPENEEPAEETMFDTTAAAQPIDFTDLYDKETEKGETAHYQASHGKKKTTVPVLICIICALICIAATILVLFVVPSKINLLKSRNTKEETVQTETIPDNTVTEPALQPAEAEPVQPVEPAENEIIVAKPEAVTPSPPPAPVKQPENIRYKIKWGDTLWDLAGTYYRNPWRYHEIARYNNIKDPDYIISGTYITIPEK